MSTRVQREEVPLASRRTVAPIAACENIFKELDEHNSKNLFLRLMLETFHNNKHIFTTYATLPRLSPFLLLGLFLFFDTTTIGRAIQAVLFPPSSRNRL